jgi:hypothetical protein
MADKIQTIKVIPVVYLRNADGSYVKDLRNQKLITKIGDVVEATDLWDGLTSYEDPNNPNVVFTTNLAEIQMTKAQLDVIVPKLIENNFNPSVWVYVSNAFGSNTDYHGFTFNGTTFGNEIQQLLNDWSGITFYPQYFNSYPKEIILDFEDEITNFINGDVGVTGATCAAAINLLNLALAKTKQVATTSTVFQYNCPSLPYYFQFANGNGSNWFAKNWTLTDESYLAEKTRLLAQHKQKIAAFISNSDLLSFMAYPVYSESAWSGTTGAQSEWMYNNTYSGSQQLSGSKGISISVSSVIFPGSEYVLNGVSLAYIEALPSLIASDAFMVNYTLRPAKIGGARYVTFWDSWGNNADAAGGVTSGNNNNDQYVYINRKLANDLFTDTGIGITHSLQDNAFWQAASTKLTILEAATQKTINLAIAYRQI